MSAYIKDAPTGALPSLHELRMLVARQVLAALKNGASATVIANAINRGAEEAVERFRRDQ